MHEPHQVPEGLKTPQATATGEHFWQMSLLDRRYIVCSSRFEPAILLMLRMSQGAELLSQKSLLFSSVSDDPNCDKVVMVNAVHHSLINLEALPDFLLDDDIALRYFDLKD